MTDNSAQLETRVARLEAQTSGILTELRDFRTYAEKKFEQIDAKFDRVNERITALHVSVTEKFGEINEKFGEIKVWALTLLGGGILTVIARALHWI